MGATCAAWRDAGARDRRGRGGRGRGGRLYAWQTRPVVRIPVAIAPVANHTGEPELDAYRMALTADPVDELRESPNIRVVRISAVARDRASVHQCRRYVEQRRDSGDRHAERCFVCHRSVARYPQRHLAGTGSAASVDTGTVTNSYETEPVPPHCRKTRRFDRCRFWPSGFKRISRPTGRADLYGSRPDLGPVPHPRRAQGVRGWPERVRAARVP